jgi:outer membrane protein assembly factor BamB
MTRTAISRALLLPVLLFLGTIHSRVSQAADWPQFRGPARTDVSKEKNLLKEWPSDGPPVVWKADGFGKGYSSIAVAGDRIYSMGDKGDSSFLAAFDRKTGNLVWETKVGPPGGNYEGTRCTPTVDDNRVYGLGQFGDFICCDAKNGEELWRTHLKNDFGGQHGAWQYTESPLVDGDKVICTPGGSQATMLSLNKKTGEVVWKGVVPGGDTAGYSSIVVSKAGGIHQYVQLMSNGLVGMAAEDGKFLWRYGESGDRFGGNTANIPTPIVQGDYIFASAGYGRGGGLIKLAGKEGGIAVEEVYFEPSLQNRHGGVVLVGDHLYGDGDSSGRPWCAEFKTGKVVWEKDKRSDGSGSAAITYADGRLYVLYDNGVAALVDASPKAYNEISAFQIPDAAQPCWSHPVVSGGKLYLRSQDTLWCLDIAKK